MSSQPFPTPTPDEDSYGTPAAFGDAQPYGDEWGASSCHDVPARRGGPWTPRDTSPLSVAGYMLTLLVACIPLVGLAMLFLWSFDSRTNLNKRNFCRAVLLLLALLLGAFVLLQWVLLPAILEEMAFLYY